MDASRLVRRLRAVGANAEIADAGILLDGACTHLEVMNNRPATPSDLQRIADLCSAKSSSHPIRPIIAARRASPLAVSWLETHPDVTLVLDEQVILNGVAHSLDDQPPAAPRRKGPVPYARFATMRVLLSGASRKDQVRLAQLAGVTQGSVSNALRRIPETRDPGARFDEILRDYPGPGGHLYYWWSNRRADEQAQHLAAQGALLSGDFAADRLAPWRMPERAVAYVDAPLDLSAVGYVLADPSDYTTLVMVPRDPTLRATAKTWGAPDVVDPIIAAHDVIRTATTGDQHEAVDKLRDVVIQRFTDAHGDGHG